MNIIGKKILLRAIEEEDLPLLHQWANDPEIQEVLAGWHFPTNRQDQQRWYTSLSCQSDNQRFVVQDQANGKVVGTLSLTDIDWKNRVAFLGIMIGRPELRGTGLALDAVNTATRYCFEEIGMNRVESDVVASNVRSHKFFTQKCGWFEEGVRPESYYRQGEWHDKILIGITHKQYGQSEAVQKYWAG